MPRAGVTKEKVFTVAKDLANTGGYEQLTLSGIAAVLGIRTPSLYKHVTGLEEIQEHLAWLGYHGLLRVFSRSAVNAPSERVRAVARAYRQFARENPGLYAALQRTHLARPVAVQSVAGEVLNDMFELLRALKVRENDLVNTARSLRSTLHGFVALELAGGFGLAEDRDESFEFLITHWLKGLGIPGL